MASSILFDEFLIGSACDVGRRRKSNQDALDVILPAEGIALPPLLVVADGMGGHKGGETASRLVIEQFREVYIQLRHPLDAAQALRACAEKSHWAIRELAAKDRNLTGMGSTVVAAFLQDGRVDMLNVGDSRAYILRGEEVRQISVDQSWVMDQVRAGKLTLEQARRHRKRNRLSMSLSANRPTITPILKTESFERDNILLLCSDGLWGAVPESLMWAAANEFEPQEAAEKLVALANQSGGPDNISVIVVQRRDRRKVKVESDETTNG
ncbi:MAG: PP2C family protein-serine/threonine phosphatase [Chloroflexota bacterium]